MAKKSSGEVTLKAGNINIRLRLDIGQMMEIEDHFDMGLVALISKRLPECRIKDIAAIFTALTGGDLSDPDEVRQSAELIMKIGLMEAAQAIGQCMQATLAPEMPAAAGKPGK